jgi:hypothetical protein
MEEIEEKTKPKGVNYWIDNKELPFGFDMIEKKGRKTYAFEEDKEWLQTKAKLDAIESLLMKASDDKVS